MSEFKNKRLVKLEWDYAGTDSAGVSNATVAAHPTGVFVPDNAIVTDVFYEVSSSFRSAADGATMALHLEGANDLVSATAVGVATVWGLGIRGTLAGSPTLGDDAAHTDAIMFAALKAASFIKVAGQEELTFTVGGADGSLTAGHLTLYIEYVLGL